MTFSDVVRCMKYLEMFIAYDVHNNGIIGVKDLRYGLAKLTFPLSVSMRDVTEMNQLVDLMMKR